MKKRVFLGSSRMAEEHLKTIGKIISAYGAEVVPWREVFSPSCCTFPEIEKTMKGISGAILVASPDIAVPDIEVNDVKFIPTPNVILELGLFSSRLLRPRIALCKFDNTELPTDLDSFTHVKLGEYPPKGQQLILSTRTRRTLAQWTKNLPLVGKNIPATSVIHGFSGRWSCTMIFRKWRERKLLADEEAVLNGEIDLFLSPDEGFGFGSVHGDLHLVLLKPEYFSCTVNVNDIITDAEVKPDGSLCFWSHTQSRRIAKKDGKDPGLEGSGDNLSAGPEMYRWELKPGFKGNEEVLQGRYFMAHNKRDRAMVIARKIHDTATQS